MTTKELKLFELFLECHGMTEQYAAWKKNGGPQRTKAWMESEADKNQITTYKEHS